MSILRTVWAEFIGLFVDDWRFAAQIVVWIAAAWLILPNIPAPWNALALAAGLLAILAADVVRKSR